MNRKTSKFGTLSVLTAMTLLVPSARITPIQAQTVLKETQAEGGFSIVEDMTSTTTDELFKINYVSGDWVSGTHHPDLFHDGYEHYSNGDASYTMRFIGTGVEIWASRNKAHGLYTVTIDGEDAGTADGSTTGATVHQQKIYEKTGLSNGEHVITVSFSGQSGKAIQLDYLKVYHDDIAPSAIHLDQKSVLLSCGDSTTLRASFDPWVASGEITWSSSDESAATVHNGVVQAADDLKEARTVTITASCGTLTDSCQVLVDPDAIVYEPYSETHTALRSAFYAGSIPDNTWVFAGGRTTMGGFSDIRGTRNYVRLLEEYWRYDGRHRNNMSVNNYRAYMHNTGAAGESLSDTLDRFESQIRPLNPRFVSYMIDEEDFQQGKAGLEQFKANLQTLIDNTLSLRGGTDSFLAIETPWARQDPLEKNNAARYALAAREVVDSLPEVQRNRVMIVDVLGQTDNASFRESCLKEDGSLKNTGHLRIANAISSVVYGSGKIGLSDSSLNAFQEVSKPSVYLEQTPEAVAGNSSLDIRVPDKADAGWNYRLETDHGTICGALEQGSAHVENLHDKDAYTLTITSADGTTQLRRVHGIVEEGKKAEELSPVLTEKTENQKKIEEVVESSEPKTWLFIGDSITHGAAWTKGYDSCTQNFEKYLKEDLDRKDDVVINTAISGCTTEDHLKDPDYRVKNYTADVVVIMLGMNDFDSGMSLDTFKSNLKTIAGWCLENNPGCQVVLRACQSVNPSSDQAEYDQLHSFCQAVNEVAEEEDWILVDHTKTWDEARKQQSYIDQAGYWNGNRHHPNGRGHQIMLKDMLEAMGLQNAESELYNMEYDLKLKDETSTVVVLASVSRGTVRVDLDELQQALGSVIGKAEVSMELDGVTYSDTWSILDENPVVEIGNLPAFKNARVHVKAWLRDSARTLEMNSAPLMSESALDREDLQALVDQALLLKQDGYTDQSWSAFESALEEARAVLAEEQADQSEIARAWQALNQAMASLELEVEIPEAELFYDFDGDPLKDKAGDYDASTTGEAAYESGYQGQAFTTGQAVVKLSEDLKVGTDDFTVSYWIRVDKNVNDTALFSNKTSDGGKEKGVFIRNYNGIYVNAADGTSRYDTDLYDHDTTTLNGSWHLLTAVFDRDRAVSLYVDGKLYNENTDFGAMVGTSLDTGNAFILGGGPLNDPLDGAVDEFKFYRAALDADQVQALYHRYDVQRKTLRDNLKALQQEALAFRSSSDWATLNESLKEDLRNALDLTSSALADTSGAQQPCSFAYQALKTALEACQTGITLGDLQSLLQEAEALNSEDYTEESWNSLLQAMDEARELIRNESTDRQAIDQAWQALKEAMSGLEVNVQIPQAELHYDFENASLADLMGHYDAAPVGTPSWESGFRGQAFTTGKACATIDDAFRMGTDDITISFWVRVDKNANNIGFFSNKKSDGGTEKGVFMRTWKGVYVNAADGTTRSDTDTYIHDNTSLDGKWHMLTAVFDRDRALSLYVDGALFIENTNFTALEGKSLDSGNPFIIGSAAKSDSRPQGAMDEFSIYRAALDADQIQAVYDGYQKEKKNARHTLIVLQEKAQAFLDTDAFEALEDSLKEALRQALDQAQTALLDASGAMEPCLAAISQLEEAMEAAGVDEPEPEKEANRTLLNMAIAYVQALNEDDLNDLNGIVRQELDAALDAALNLPENASQEEVNAAWLRLTHVIHMLDFTSNKAELQAAIVAAEAIDLNDYKDEGKDAFLAALNHAREIALSDTALDPSIQEALAALQEAMNALVPVDQLDTTLLEQLLLVVSEADEEDYTPSTWQAFAQRKTEAAGVLEAPESQEQIQDMIMRLHQAWLDLRLKPSEELLSVLRPFSIQCASLDLNLFQPEQARKIRLLKADVDATLATPDLTMDEARTLVQRVEEVQPLLDEVTGSDKPEENQKPEDSRKPDSGENPSSDSRKNPAKETRKEESSEHKSVKTASSLHGGFWMGAGSAALACLSLFRRRNRK